MICAEYIRIAFTWFGVRPGFACIIRATAPDTTPVAIDVPVRTMYRLLLLTLFPVSTCSTG